MLRRIRPVLIVVGGLLLVGSLLGAKLLATGGAEPTPKTAAPPTNGKAGTGPVVIGYVDSDPRPVVHGLPPVLQSGLVTKVFVKEGQEVKQNDKLIQFDTTVQDADLNIAQKTVGVANAKLAEAKAGEKIYADELNIQTAKLAAAETKLTRRQKEYHVAEYNFKETLKAGEVNITQAKIDEKVKNDPDLFRRSSEYELARLERDREQTALDTLKTLKEAKVDVGIAAAEAAVKQAQAAVTKAQAAVDHCTVRAKVAGTVEQINVGPGDTLGIGSQVPALVLVPGGPRVVRAEIEAEFAHKITGDKIDKVVTIYDNSDGKLTYKGTVKRIGTAFLPKRGSGGAAAGLMIANETRVLEAVIEVTDATPPGVPPLRVGQKVRVNFGQ